MASETQAVHLLLDYVNLSSEYDCLLEHLAFYNDIAANAPALISFAAVIAIAHIWESGGTGRPASSAGAGRPLRLRAREAS